MRFESHGWVAEVDVDATRRAYAAGGPGASVECGCTECGNFIEARDAGYVYPAEVADLLLDMGVDPNRESEIYAAGPVDHGSIRYGGWFNIAGQLVEDRRESTDIEPGFALYPMPEGALVDPAFGQAPVFRIEFEVIVPWMASRARKR